MSTKINILIDINCNIKEKELERSYGALYKGEY